MLQHINTYLFSHNLGEKKKKTYNFCTPIFTLKNHFLIGENFCDLIFPKTYKRLIKRVE